MKPRQPFFARRREAGSTVLYALIVLAAGAAVLAGWIHVMAARAIYTEQMEAAVQRRVVLENSRLLASQYLLQQVLPGSHPAALNVVHDSGWAAFSLSGPAEGDAAWVPLESVDQPAAVNQFSPGGAGGYTISISASLSDGDSDHDWVFQARSRAPMLGFDLFSSQRPTLSPSAQSIVSSTVSAMGNAVLWAPNAPHSYGLSAASYQTPTVSFPTASPLTGSGGAPLLMSNFAFLPQTAGPAGGGYGYDGSLNVVDPGTSAPNSLANRVTSSAHVTVITSETLSVPGVSCDGAGVVTIDLNEAGLNKVLIVGGASTINLVGQTPGDSVAATAAEALPAVLIVYHQEAAASFDLAAVNLQGSNTRRVHLGVRKDSGSSFAVTGTSGGNPLPWRLGLTVENAPMVIGPASGALVLTGGVRSDRSVQTSGGTVSLVRETDPKLLERYADRNAWLEAYAQ